MRYLSVASGIEAATQAWHPLGFIPVGVSEIDKFPSAVLAHHLPDVPNAGDFTTIKGNQYGPIDILVGGTPCQSFSVAGKRGGMEDARGNLALEFIRLAYRSRPQWVLWENVPGVLSSAKGADFASFLSGLTGVELPVPTKGWKNSGVISGFPGCYSVAWRVLDAQYFGVPQRRRRVFVVGHLGDWRRAASVLLGPESLLGNPAPSREARERVAPCLDARTKGGGAGWGSDFMSGGGLVASTETPDIGGGGAIQRIMVGRESGKPDLGCSSSKGPVYAREESLPGRIGIPATVGALTDGAHNGGGLNGQDVYTGRIIPWQTSPTH